MKKLYAGMLLVGVLNICSQSVDNYLLSRYQAVVDEIITVTKIPAPTFHEEKRAAYVKEQMDLIGVEAEIDEALNVIMRYPGKERTAKLVVCAHTDVVFDFSHFPVNPTYDGEKLKAPGIGDNTAYIVVMMELIRAWKATGYVPECDVVFLACSCEEGLGDLKGTKHFFNTYIKRQDVDLKLFISFDKHYQHIVREGVASRRLKVTYQTEGGHSWFDFGNSSAINALGKCVEKLTHINLPTNKKTTLNIGMINGGTSINTIAQEATMYLDLRSLDMDNLAKLELVTRSVITHQAQKGNAEVMIEVVGDRPGGEMDENHPLLVMTQRVAEEYGIKTEFHPGSSDANVPQSLGIPAFTIGCCERYGIHTVSEYIIPETLKKGMPYCNKVVQKALTFCCFF